MLPHLWVTNAHLTARSSAARSGALPRSSSGHQYDASWMAAPCLRAANVALLPRPLPTAPSASSWPHLGGAGMPHQQIYTTGGGRARRQWAMEHSWTYMFLFLHSSRGYSQPFRAPLILRIRMIPLLCNTCSCSGTSWYLHPRPASYSGRARPLCNLCELLDINCGAGGRRPVLQEGLAW